MNSPVRTGRQRVQGAFYMTRAITFLKKLKDKIKGYDYAKMLKTLVTVVAFIASIVTIVGVILIVPQLKLTNNQLKELNRKAEIDIKLRLATSTPFMGPSRSEPLSFSVV